MGHIITGYFIVQENHPYYGRTSIIWPSIIRISGLTDPKPCPPTYMYNARSSMNDNTVFYTF